MKLFVSILLILSCLLILQQSIQFFASHEGGTFGEYTQAVTNGGDLSISQSAGMNGTLYGIQAVINDNNVMYALKDFGSDTSGVMTSELWFDPNSISLSQYAQVSFAFYINSVAQNFASIKIARNTSTYYLRTTCIDDNGVHKESPTYPISDAPHLVRIRVVRATSASANDGYIELWVDGVQKNTSTGLDNYNKFADFRYASFGKNSIAGTISGSFYIDEISVMAGTGSTTATPTSTFTPTATPTSTPIPTGTFTPSPVPATPTATPSIIPTVTQESITPTPISYLFSCPAGQVVNIDVISESEVFLRCK